MTGTAYRAGITNPSKEPVFISEFYVYLCCPDFCSLIFSLG